MLSFCPIVEPGIYSIFPAAGPTPVACLLLAAILGVVDNCRRLKIPVRDYLGTILPGLANTPIQRVPELTPTAWIHSGKQA